MMQRAADVGVPAELITAARAVNRTMPIHVAGVLNELLYKAGVPAGEGKVLLLGWSYKAEVGDPRETPAEPLTEALNPRILQLQHTTHTSMQKISLTVLKLSATLILLKDMTWQYSLPHTRHAKKSTGQDLHLVCEIQSCTTDGEFLI